MLRHGIALLFACATLALVAATTAAGNAAPFPPATPSPSASTSPAALTAPPGVPEEIGTVSTSDRHVELSSQAARPTFVVTRAQIDARGDRTIAQALEQTPGVDLYSYGGFGAQVNYGIRGSTSEQTLVLVDGQPVANGSTGSIDLGSLSTAGVSRIEVVESGASTLYGTSAVGGVINIITGVPRGAYLEISDGSYGDRDLRVAEGYGPIGISFERHIATNDFAFPALYADPPGVRENAQAEQSTGRLTLNEDLGAGWRIAAEFGTNAIAIGVPGDLDFGNDLTATQSTSQDDIRLSIAKTSAVSSLTLTYAGSRQNLAYDDPSIGGEEDVYDGRSQVSLRSVLSSGRSTLVSGIDLDRLSVTATNDAATATPDFDARQSQSAIYAQETYALGGGSQLYAGVRGERDSPLGSVAAPSVGGILALGPLRLKANGGESFRVPSFDELYYPGFGNPALLPERSSNTDVTLEAPGVGGGLSLGWFGRNASNLIETVLADPTTFTYLPENVQHASIAGTTLTARSRPFGGGVVATLGLTDIYRALDLTPGAPPSRLTFEPVLTTTFTLERPITPTGIGYGIDARIAGSHVESEGGLNAYGTSRYDAFVRGRIARDAIATVRVRNLFDDRDEPIAGYPALGRTVELELSTR